MENVIENTDYELELLKNLAYSFYPKGICATNNLIEYKNTPQYLLLAQTLEKQKLDPLNRLIDDFKNLPIEKQGRDVTRFSWGDRAYNLQFTEVRDDYLMSICLNISILIPYYALYVLKVKLKDGSQEWLTQPKKLDPIEEREYQKDLKVIETFIEQKLNLKKLPLPAYSTVIEKIKSGYTYGGIYNI